MQIKMNIRQFFAYQSSSYTTMFDYYSPRKFHKRYVAAFSFLLDRRGKRVLSGMALKFSHTYFEPRWTFFLFLKRPSPDF